jgi:Uncharacterized protein conserved in bacteria (DUF2252)
MTSTQTAEATAQRAQRYQLDSGLGQLTPAERAARGKEARAAVPQESHAVFDPGSDRPDPLALLEEQAKALGGADVFDQAITRFAAAYADQNERDHQALVDAVDSGRITAERDT